MASLAPQCWTLYRVFNSLSSVPGRVTLGNLTWYQVTLRLKAGPFVVSRGCLIRSTNAGGENVARGALLGALLGASKGMAAWTDNGASHLVDDLVDRHDIRREVEAFLQKVGPRVGGPLPREGGINA